MVIVHIILFKEDRTEKTMSCTISTTIVTILHLVIIDKTLKSSKELNMYKKMSIIFEIDDIKTLDEVMTSDYEVIIIDIYADWCNPCKYLAPKIEELARQYSNMNILFCKLNTETSLKPQIKGLPTIEFWVGKSKKTLFHSVLGADYNEVVQTLKKIVGEPKTPQTSVFQQTSLPPKTPRASSTKDNPYKTFGQY